MIQSKNNNTKNKSKLHEIVTMQEDNSPITVTSTPDDNNESQQQQHDNSHKKRNLPTPKSSSPSLSPSTTIQHNDHMKKNTKKSKKSKTKTKHLNPLVLNLRRTIHQCCATNDFHRAKLAYQELHINQNVTLETQSFYNLLNLCGGEIGGNKIHIGTPKHHNNNNNDNKFETNDNHFDEDEDEEDKTHTTTHTQDYYYTPAQRQEFAFQIKNEMDSLHIPLNESAYTALIRILCQQQSCQTTHNDISRNNNKKNLQQAEELLDQAECTQQCKPKLRMYSCLIDAFCHEDNNDLIGALRIWKRVCNLSTIRMNKTSCSSIELSEKEYCSIMKCAIRVGDLGVMERVLSEIAEDVLIPSIDTKDTIISWFQSSYAVVHAKPKQSALDSVQDLPKCNVPSMGPIQYVIDNSNNDRKNDGEENKTPTFWEVTIGDIIDSKSGILLSGCLKGEALKPIQVCTQAWIRMIEMNEDIVVKGELSEHGNIPFAGGGKGKKRLIDKTSLEKRIRQWDAFKAFLSQRVGPSCDKVKDIISEEDTTVHDKKRFDVVIDGANVGYYKRNFANCPKHVDYKQIDWVVTHFYNEGKRVLLVMHERHFSKNLMPKWAESIVRKWDDAGILYRTPHGTNDDYFWMHAALWCGQGTQVLSNDLMRDHHFQMLAYRSFLRWQERHQVNFDVGGWEGNQREIILKYPDVYSRRIQRVGSNGLVIPLPKRGDENRFLDGLHEADESAPIDETYVCIRLRV